MIDKEIRTPGAAFRYNPKLQYNRLAFIGSMDVVCDRCKAKKWILEPDILCCPKKEKWQRYPHLNALQGRLKILYEGQTVDGKQTEESKHFLNNILKYNSCFQMTSFKADKIIHDWSTFKVQGQLYHKLGSLLPEKDIEEKFLQIYFISDFNKQAQLRCNISPETKENIVRDIQQYLSDNNLLIRNFKSALDNGMRNNPDNFDIVICADKAPPGHHAGRYNAPVVDEVSAVITGLKHGRRDIVIKHREGQLTSIQDTNHAYDALQYPLIYTMGEDGYDFGIAIVDEDKNPIINKGKKRYVTAMNYYAYMLMIRDDESNHLHKS